MTTYQRGAKGPEVKQIQEKLKALDLYLGSIDGDFGGGTESAVIRFKKAKGVPQNGKVDEQTWKLLFPEEPSIPEPTVTKKPCWIAASNLQVPSKPVFRRRVAMQW